MGKLFNFTDGIFDRKEKEIEEEIQEEVRSESVSEFISYVLEEMADNMDGFTPVVMELGSIIMFLFFDTSKNPDGDLVHGCVGINFFGKEWNLVPGDGAQAIIDLFLENFEAEKDIRDGE